MQYTKDVLRKKNRIQKKVLIISKKKFLSFMSL